MSLYTLDTVAAQAREAENREDETHPVPVGEIGLFDLKESNNVNMFWILSKAEQYEDRR